MKFPPQFQHLIAETFTRFGGRLLALVLLIWLVVLLINVSMSLTHAGTAAVIPIEHGGCLRKAEYGGASVGGVRLDSPPFEAVDPKKPTCTRPGLLEQPDGPNQPTRKLRPS
jgi:hypothetical protein